MKKSESLAVENAQRIAIQLRQERNDALALAQVKRELLDCAIAMLREVAGKLPADTRLDGGAMLGEAVEELLRRASP